MAPSGVDARTEADSQRALLNILDDSAADTSRLQDSQRALLNILDDLDLEKATLELAEEEIHAHSVDLERVNESLEAFSYSVAHDLRTPLHTLSGFSQALLEDYAASFDETARDYAQRIQSASERMATRAKPGLRRKMRSA